MSIVTLQYGQCGNQIGEALFSCIYEDLLNNKKERDYYYNTLLKWFNVTKDDMWEPKSLLIDCEVKAVNQIKKAPFKFKNIICKSYGSCANNWAYGYSNRSKLLIDEILDSIRMELEKSDMLSSFLNIFSSSGGTGSGVGSYVIESLRKEFPKKTVINAIVLPYMCGEVVVQSYNSLLTLSKVYPLSDASILIENDRLHYNCSHSLNIYDVNFANINNLIAQQLISIFHPLKNVNSAHILGNLTAHPLFKFLTVQSTPLLINKEANVSKWIHLLNSLTRQSRFDFHYQNKIRLKEKSVSAALISRGQYKPSERDFKHFKESLLHVSWLPKNECFKAYYQPNKVFDTDNYLTLIANNNRICCPVNTIFEDAWNSFKFGAYLHHYNKFGIGTDYFQHSFEELNTIILNYKKLE